MDSPVGIGSSVTFFLSSCVLAGTILAALVTFVDRYVFGAIHRPPPELLIVRMRPDAIPLTKHHNAAGFDVSTCEEVLLPAHSVVVVFIGWAARAPPGTYLRVGERSGLAKSNVGVGAGVIDQDYTGEIGVVLRNYGTELITLPAQSKVAQLIPTCVAYPALREVSSLPSTGRGRTGFGSSG